MLDKTRHPNGTVAKHKKKKKAPLHNRDELVELHGKMARRLDFHTAIECDISEMAVMVRDFALTNYREVFGNTKSHKLPGGAMGLMTIAGRVSCGDNMTGAVHEALRKLGHAECIKQQEAIDTEALKMAIEKDPKLLAKLQKEVPTFSMGKPYEQFWIEFAGKDKRVTGDAQSMEFSVTIPDKKKKKKTAKAA